MFENIMKIFKKSSKKEGKASNNSKDAAKERLHLVLMQDRANVSADFLELMKQEIIDVIKKYIDVDESAIDVRLTNKENSDGTNGAPALYANIPILNIKNEARKMETKKEEQKSEVKEEIKKDDSKQKDKNQDSKKEESESTEVTEVEKENEEKDEKKNEQAEQKSPEEEIKSEN